jgi:hypothetical protein
MPITIENTIEDDAAQKTNIDKKANSLLSQGLFCIYPTASACT